MIPSGREGDQTAGSLEVKAFWGRGDLVRSVEGGRATWQLAFLGMSESEYETRFTSPSQTDWVMRCTPRKVLRTAEQEPVVPPLRGRAA